jgi:hypothetical protein
MWTMKRIGVMTLAGLGVLGLPVVPAHGQFFRGGTLPVYAPGVNPRSPFYNPINPLTYVAPGVTSQQALFNTFQPLNAASRLPPWMYGYNPYPSPIITSGPVVPYGGSGYNPGPNPYLYSPSANPYGAGYGGNPYGGSPGYGDVSNPYSAALGGGYGGAGYNPYSYYPPYGTDALTGLMYGSASIVQAQGKLMINQEQARLMREIALQEQLKTKKMRAEYEWWYNATKPTFTDEQARYAKNTLRRIQDNATPGEIAAGRAMNILLKDLAKHADKKSGISTMPLDEDVLKRLNVTTRDGGPNPGFLRSEGQFNWPAALFDLAPEKTRTDIEELARELYKLAVLGELKPNLPRDLETRLERLQEMLRSKVNEIPSGQYMAASRFLTDFRSAVAALTQPNLITEAMRFQREFARGGKTAQEVADYMISHGLWFAPANPGDEGAYQAVHTGLANYDVTLNAQLASSR